MLNRSGGDGGAVRKSSPVGFRRRPSSSSLFGSVRRCNFDKESTWFYGRGEHRDGTGEGSVAVSAGDVFVWAIGQASRIRGPIKTWIPGPALPSRRTAVLWSAPWVRDQAFDDDLRSKGTGASLSRQRECAIAPTPYAVAQHMQTRVSKHARVEAIEY